MGVVVMVDVVERDELRAQPVRKRRRVGSNRRGRWGVDMVYALSAGEMRSG
jgi:hypothetical protein